MDVGIVVAVVEDVASMGLTSHAGQKFVDFAHWYSERLVRPVDTTSVTTATTAATPTKVSQKKKIADDPRQAAAAGAHETTAEDTPCHSLSFCVAGVTACGKAPFHD